jgi:hypothetical protein
MTPDYFSSRDRVAALRRACEGWLHTPFRERSKVKGPGGGVDCANFVAAVFLEIGAITEKIAVPPYANDWAEHNQHSILREWFEQPAARRRVRRVDEAEAHLDGDIVFPKIGQCEHHLGLRIGDAIFHVVRPNGVCRQGIRDVALEKSRYRLMEAAP